MLEKTLQDRSKADLTPLHTGRQEGFSPDSCLLTSSCLQQVIHSVLGAWRQGGLT
jgi:hypothetical protein